MPRSLLTLLGIATAAWSANLVPDGDFTQSAGWKLPANSPWQIVDDDGHSGSFSLRYRSEQRGQAAPVVREVACQANTDYVLAAWLKSDGSVHPAVRIAGLAELVSHGAPGLWDEVRGKLNSGAATRLKIELYGDIEHVAKRDGYAGAAWIDDVQLWPAAEAPAPAGPGAARPGENLAFGRPYTLQPAPSYGLCTDENDKFQLTDGIYSVGYFWTQKSTVGWSRGRPIVVTIDLGSVAPICGASLNTAAGVAGVSWPGSIFVCVSDDGQQWWLAGELIELSGDHGLPAVEPYRVHRYWTDKLATHGRYVSFLSAPGTGYFFTDEIEIYKGPAALLDQERAGAPFADPKVTFEQKMQASTVRNRVGGDLRAARQAIAESALPPADKQRWDQALAAALAKTAALNEVAPGFQAVVPYTREHAAAYAARAALWRAAGRPALQVWPAGRWDQLTIDALPPDGVAAPRVEVVMMRDEVRGAALNVTNAGEQAVDLTVTADGLPGGAAPGWLAVKPVAWTARSAGGETATALPDAARSADGWKVTAPAGMTRQIWLSVDSTSLPAGRHAGRLRLTPAGGKPVEVPFAVRVSPLRMPAELTLSLGGWDYTDTTIYGVNDQNRDAVVAFLKEHRLDSPWATAAAMPFGTHDAQGKMTAPPDTKRMDAWLERWRGARYYGCFNSVSGELKDAAAQRRVEEWINFWVAHLKEKGIRPSQLKLHLYDESSAAETDRIFIAWAAVVRRAQPEVVVFNDPTWTDPRKATPELLSLSTELCPNRQHWQNLPAVFEQVYGPHLKRGAALSFYSCSGPVRSMDPYGYHRLQAWDCFRYGMTAEYFWAFGDNGGASSWNELAAPGVGYSPQFVGSDGCTTSKHMEGVREGRFDYQYLVMLREAVAAAEKAGRADAAKAAKALLESAPARVLEDNPVASISWNFERDRELADQVRIELLDALEALAR